MAGFMSPAGFGAFVSGFAKQANQNIETQKLEDRQNDIIWMNKFERGLSEYNKEKDKNDQVSQVYNTYLQNSGGNKKLTDAAMGAFLANPKEGYMQGLYIIAQNKDNPAMSQGEDYQSTLMGNMQSNLSSKYGHLQDIRNSMRPQAQRFTQMPSNAPGQIPQYQPAQQNMGTTQSLGSNPSDMVPATGTGLDQQIGNAPSTGEIPLDTQPNIKTTPLQDREAAFQDNFPYQTQPGGMNAPSQQQSNIVPGILSGNKTASGMILPPQKGMTLTPAEQLAASQRQQSIDLAKQREARESAQHMPASPGAEEYERGLGKKYAAALGTDITKLSNDANTIISYIESGQLQTGGWQPLVDAAARMAAPLGIDISPYVHAMLPLKPNDPAASDLAKKAMTALQADITTAAKFARVTNFEFMTMGKASPQIGSNPQANIYMALTLKKIVERTIDKNNYVREHAMDTLPNGMQRINVYKMDKAATEWDKQHAEESAVPQLNSKTMSPEQYQNAKTALGPGTYYLDMGTGFMGRVGWSQQ